MGVIFSAFQATQRKQALYSNASQRNPVLSYTHYLGHLLDDVVDLLEDEKYVNKNVNEIK